MTAEEFKIFWTSNYPDTIPIGHHFRHDYADRWFRIHSLPDSRRYPSGPKDWDILLSRQNTILTDLITNGSPFALVTGEFYIEGYTDSSATNETASVKPFAFTRLEPIDLHLHDPVNYEKGQIYTLMFTEQVWSHHKYDEILRDVAEDNLRVFFVSICNNYIVAPYDGGMDIILRDSSTRDLYKERYRQWLSFRDDGL